tara:strand:- start:268 stop:537 length:270 start_codon:yes stop_codon:yes gene_type:complete
MPTKKELLEKINKLETENKKLKEENKKNDKLLIEGADFCNDLAGFIKILKLWDIFLKTMDEGELVIDEVKHAVNNICPKCSNNSYSKGC